MKIQGFLLVSSILFSLFPGRVSGIRVNSFLCRIFSCFCKDNPESRLDHPKLEWAPADVAISEQMIILFEESAEDVHAKVLELLDGNEAVVVLNEYTDSPKGFAVGYMNDEATLLSILEDEEVACVEQDREAVDLMDSNEVCVTNPPNWGLDRIDQAPWLLDKEYCYRCTGKGVKAFVFEKTGILSSHRTSLLRMG